MEQAHHSWPCSMLRNQAFHKCRFGNVLKGEVESCQEIAQKTGILLDPIYTLAAWEHAVHFCQEEAYGDTKVVMLHTGGTLGMFGLAQRYKSFFHTSKGAVSGKM